MKPIGVERNVELFARQIREQILRGDIRQGTLLPNERNLVDRTGLSRGSVREALKVLEAQGFLSTKLGRSGGRVVRKPGAEVIRNSLRSVIDGQEIPFPALLETIAVLEPSLAALAAQHRNETDLALLRRETRRLSRTANPSRFLLANARWHRTMAEASHNIILIAVYDALGSRLLDPHITGFASAEIRSTVVDAVGRIEAAIEAGDAAAARRRMERHVRAYREQVEARAPPIVTL